LTVTGAAYLGGGGTGDDEALLWREMLGCCQRLLYWPFALDGDLLAGAERWLHDQVAQRGFSVEIRTWMTLQGKRSADLDEFDLLFVGGGNTFRLLHHLQVHGFVEPVRRWVVAGGNYYGGSAGAVLATDSVAIAGYVDGNEVGLVDLDGLGLLPAVALLPHYTVDQQDLAHSISRDLGQPVVAVPEAAGLVVAEGRIRTVGPGGVWTVTGDRAVEHAPGSALNITEGRRRTSP
jgi:dipeptidase E